MRLVLVQILAQTRQTSPRASLDFSTVAAENISARSSASEIKLASRDCARKSWIRTSEPPIVLAVSNPLTTTGETLYLFSHLRRILLWTLLVPVFAGSAWSADTYIEKASPHKHCPLGGSAPARSKKAEENILKNRWRAPRPADFDNRVTTKALSRAVDDPTWSPKRAARIKGYVALVKANTDGEACNCGAKHSIDCDTHIAVVPDRASLGDRRKYVFVEVTPRIRELLAAQNPPIDWTSEALKKRLPGKRVDFEGWMFFDYQHKGAAVASHPVDPKGVNWRATCWEIHPVTSIQILGVF